MNISKKFSHYFDPLKSDGEFEKILHSSFFLIVFVLVAVPELWMEALAFIVGLFIYSLSVHLITFNADRDIYKHKAIPALHSELGLVLVSIKFTDRFIRSSNIELKKTINYQLCYDSEHAENIEGDYVDYSINLKFLGVSESDDCYYFTGIEPELHKLHPFTEQETKKALRLQNKRPDDYSGYICHHMDFDTIIIGALGDVKYTMYTHKSIV